MLNLITCDGEHCTRIEGKDEILEALRNGGILRYWLDLEKPTEDEFALLESHFHFHPLSIEDAGSHYERPKADEYEAHSYLSVDSVSLDLSALDNKQADSSDIHIFAVDQISIFFTAEFVVTVHYAQTSALTNLVNQYRQNKRVLSKGTDYLLYMLLDAIVDGYFPMLDELEDQMDALEDEIVQRYNENTLDKIFPLKRELNRLRKHISPLREVMQTILTREFPGISAGVVPYLRDVDDHLFRIYEYLDTFRDQSSNLLDAYLSQMNNEMNRVMRKLSAVSLIFLPLTFLTGFFGMNFEKMPWGGHNPLLWGAVMLAFAGGVAGYFAKKRWL